MKNKWKTTWSAVFCLVMLWGEAGCRPGPELTGEEKRADDLRKYLSTEYPCAITAVEGEMSVITVHGQTDRDGNYDLVEVTPYGDVLAETGFAARVPVSSASFSKTFDRFVERDGFVYDRTLSRWLVVRERQGRDEIASHARYADRIEASRTTVREKPASKKGLGDCRCFAMMFSDLDTLGITSATVNIRITTLLHSHPGEGRLEHRYGGRSYYIDEVPLRRMDKALIACRDRGIVVAGIILVNPASQSADPVIGALLQHPDFTPEGRYTMPNLTCAESTHAYAAILDFLAERYTRPDKKYGRIHYWIMHNEVDSPLEWTNMGEGKPVGVYMDTYVKSLRMCHNIVRRYDPHAEVMVSHTHAWAVADNEKTYATLDMLETLNRYCRTEGDFPWGLAFHCYPQDLRKPQTWLDDKAHYRMSTPIITYKNLEVLDHWIKLPENRYQGTEKRTLWLSENGTNSPDYTETDETRQAAGLAWGWTKIRQLDGIDAHQWHNWSDHEEEFGLRIGLRKFPKDGLAAKEVWHVYRAAGTPREEEVFGKYLPVIGIESWDILEEVGHP